MTDAFSLKLLKEYNSSHGQVKYRLTLMNKPSIKRLAQSIQSSLICTDHLHHHTKFQGNNASNEFNWEQKTLKIQIKKFRDIEFRYQPQHSRVILENPGFRKTRKPPFSYVNTYYNSISRTSLSTYRRILQCTELSSQNDTQATS